jgi:hypothetical protein
MVAAVAGVREATVILFPETVEQPVLRVLLD